MDTNVRIMQLAPSAKKTRIPVIPVVMKMEAKLKAYCALTPATKSMFC